MCWACPNVRAALPSTPAFVALETHPAPEGLYVWGSVGSGKSMLVALLYQALHETARLPAARWMHFNAAMLEVGAGGPGYRVNHGLEVTGIGCWVLGGNTGGGRTVGRK